VIGTSRGIGGGIRAGLAARDGSIYGANHRAGSAGRDVEGDPASIHLFAECAVYIHHQRVREGGRNQSGLIIASFHFKGKTARFIRAHVTLFPLWTGDLADIVSGTAGAIGGIDGRAAGQQWKVAHADTTIIDHRAKAGILVDDVCAGTAGRAAALDIAIGDHRSAAGVIDLRPAAIVPDDAVGDGGVAGGSIAHGAAEGCGVLVDGHIVQRRVGMVIIEHASLGSGITEHGAVGQEERAVRVIDRAPVFGGLIGNEGDMVYDDIAGTVQHASPIVIRNITLEKDIGQLDIDAIVLHPACIGTGIADEADIGQHRSATCPSI
jgi:hypothetical protein